MHEAVFEELRYSPEQAVGLWEIKGDQERHLGQDLAPNKSIIGVSWFISVTQHSVFEGPTGSPPARLE